MTAQLKTLVQGSSLALRALTQGLSPAQGSIPAQGLLMLMIAQLNTPVQGSSLAQGVLIQLQAQVILQIVTLQT